MNRLAKSAGRSGAAVLALTAVVSTPEGIGDTAWGAATATGWDGAGDEATGDAAATVVVPPINARSNPGAGTGAAALGKASVGLATVAGGVSTDARRAGTAGAG